MVTLGRAITEPYKKEGIQAQQNSKTPGLALGVRQKVALVGLKLLEDAVLYINNNEVELAKGGRVIVREEDLHNGHAASGSMVYDKIEGDFSIVDGNYILGYERPEPLKKSNGTKPLTKSYGTKK